VRPALLSSNSKGAGHLSKKRVPIVDDDIDENKMFANSNIEVEFENEGKQEFEWKEIHDQEASPTPTDSAELTDWCFNVPPVFFPRTFVRNAGHRHHISPEKGDAFDYFCLFIPIIIWKWS
jgi:hypothetical protein